MAMLNIGGENAGDAFYRYKMPKLQARIEGRGNGIKTNVVNNVDIAKALERPPEYVLKFYGCELGAQTKFDKQSGTSIVNGAHDANRLSELLEGFIKKYVQCYSCGNPETVVRVKKENISLKCKACGFVSDVDSRLKLNTFIIKNPPENKLSKAEKKVKKAEKERLKGLELEAGEDEGGREKKKKDKEDKKDKKDKKKKKKGEEGDDEAEGSPPAEATPPAGEDEDDGDEEEDDDGEVVWMTDVSADAVRRRAEEQLSAATAALVVAVDPEEEEAQARAKAEAAAAEELAGRDAAAGGAAVPALRALAAGGAPPKEVAAALKAAELPKPGPAARMRALYQALFGAAPADARLAALVAGAAPTLALHAADPGGQLAQLVAAEWLLVSAGRPKEAPMVLKALYDADLAEEELVLAWYNKPSAGGVLDVPVEGAAAVRAAAKPFIDWLEDAESGEDSDDE